jgi:hypothetical protein
MKIYLLQSSKTHWSMQEITKRAAIIHIDIPGQEDDAPDLPAE